MTIAKRTLFAKRAIDIIASLIALPIAAPVVAVAALAIRWHDGGSGLFRQIRVGRNQRSFTLYKLRTMVIDTRDVPSHESTKAQITELGRFLRKTKLDELPQLINVLLGDMSLVGPRPCLPSQVELVAERSARGVFAVRPGITGLGQVEGLTMADPIALAQRDAAYVNAVSVRRDLTLILRTLAGAGSGDAIGSSSQP